jgi:MFS family permease
MQTRVRTRELVNLNSYWLGLSFMWNSLHVLVLPAVLLQFVQDERKNTMLGILTFCGLVLAMIIQPVAGSLSDRINTKFGRRRPWIASGTLLDLLFLALMATAGGLPLLALGYIGLQITSNIAHGPAQGLMHDRVPLEQMGIASGVKNLFDMGGLVISSLLIGRILQPERVAGTMAVIGAVLLFGAVFTIFGVQETSATLDSTSNSRRPAFRLGDIAYGRHRAYWNLIFARLAFLTGVYGVQTFAQYYIRDTLAVADPVKLTGDLLATIVLTLIGFSIAAGHLCDRFGRKPLHVAASILLTAGSLLMTSADRPELILLYGSVIGAGIGIFVSANWALANDLAPIGQAGMFLGLTNLATAGAGALSRLAGPGIDVLNAARSGSFLGYDALFIGAGLFSLLSLLLLRRVPEGKIHQAPDQASQGEARAPKSS